MLYKTTGGGQYDTAMPAWSVEDGGPLNQAQIESVIALIQHGDWATTRLVVADLGFAPRVPASVVVPLETLKQRQTTMAAVAHVPSSRQSGRIFCRDSTSY